MKYSAMHEKQKDSPRLSQIMDVFNDTGATDTFICAHNNVILSQMVYIRVHPARLTSSIRRTSSIFKYL